MGFKHQLNNFSDMIITKLLPKKTYLFKKLLFVHRL